MGITHHGERTRILMPPAPLERHRAAVHLQNGISSSVTSFADGGLTSGAVGGPPIAGNSVAGRAWPPPSSETQFTTMKWGRCLPPYRVGQNVSDSVTTGHTCTPRNFLVRLVRSTRSRTAMPPPMVPVA